MQSVAFAEMLSQSLITQEDYDAAKAKAVGFLSSTVPSAAGLGAGIMLGLRIG